MAIDNVIATITKTIKAGLTSVNQVLALFTTANSTIDGVIEAPRVILKYAAIVDNKINIGKVIANIHLFIEINPITELAAKETTTHCKAKVINPRNPATGEPQNSAPTNIML